MISALMVSYGSCSESIPTLRELILNQDVSKIYVLENDFLKSADWEANNYNNADHIDVLIHKKITVIQSDINIGFGPGMRELFSLVETKYALIVNPDCSLSSGGIRYLLNHISNCNCAVVSGVLQKPNGEIDAKLPFMILPIAKTVMNSNSIYSNFLLKTYFPGALALFNVKSILSVGNYSNLFMYFDEIDTTFKLNKAGYKSHFIDNIVGFHSRGLTTLNASGSKSNFTAYWATRSSLTFTAQNLPLYFPTVLLARIFWGFFLLLSKQSQLGINIFKGIVDSIKFKFRFIERN
jgi:GT2 family glycosyltransferase